MPSSNDQAIASSPSSTNPPIIALSSKTPEKQSKKPSTTFHLLAGLGSGFSSAILLQPADLLKTRVQQSRSTSVLGSIREIFSEPQPIKQLWRGTLPSVIRTSFGSALYFTTLNSLRSRAAQSGLFTVKSVVDQTRRDGKNTRAVSATSSSLPKLTPLANLTSGAFARASVGFIMMPITVIKVRYESNFYNYRSLLHATRDIASKEGIKGFFSGFGATAIRDAPYAGLYVVFYEQGKKMLSHLFSRTSQSDDIQLSQAFTPGSLQSTPSITQLTPTLSASINFLSGAIAAASATLMTNPPDAIKTRLQLQPQKYRNSMQALKLMLKEEGVRSLFDGLALRMARKALSSALAWTVYEEVVRRAEAKFVDESHS